MRSFDSTTIAWIGSAPTFSSVSGGGSDQRTSGRCAGSSIVRESTASDQATRLHRTARSTAQA